MKVTGHSTCSCTWSCSSCKFKNIVGVPQLAAPAAPRSCADLRGTGDTQSKCRTDTLRSRHPIDPTWYDRETTRVRVALGQDTAPSSWSHWQKCYGNITRASSVTRSHCIVWHNSGMTAARCGQMGEPCGSANWATSGLSFKTSVCHVTRPWNHGGKWNTVHWNKNAAISMKILVARSISFSLTTAD